MKLKCYLAFGLMFCFGIVNAQLSQYEYWFDDNFAGRVTQSISGSSANISELSAGHLSNGLHHWHLRVKNTDGSYSGITSGAFFKSPLGADAKIEYWYNDDYGSKKELPANSMQDVTLNTLLDAEDMPLGLNRVHFRAMGENISSSYVLKAIIKADYKLEYWYNNNYESRKEIPLATGQDTLITYELDTDGIPVGLNSVHFRTIDGIVHTDYILKTATGENKKLEYWYNDDYASKKELTIPDEPDVTLNTLLDAEDMPLGLNSVHVRAMGGGVSSCFAIKTLVGADFKLEYWYNDDFEAKKEIPLVTTEQNTMTADLDTEDIPLGLNTVHFRTIDGIVHSDYVFKTTVGGNKKLEYWYNDDFEAKKTVSLTENGDTTELDGLDVRDMPFGLNRLHLRATDGAISSSYVMKTVDGVTNRLEYWFDDNVTKRNYLTLNNSHTLTSLTLSAGQLSYGGHLLHMRLSDASGGYAATSTDYFMHGKNPYDSSASAESLTITEYTYWFDDDTKDEVSHTYAQPAATKNFAENISAASLTANETHMFNIRFKRNDGKSVTVSEEFNTTNILTFYNPGIFLSQSSIPQGDNLVIFGNDFTPNEEVRFYFSRGIETIYATRADAQGKFEYTLAISGEFTDKEYLFYAKDMVSGKATTVQRFNVQQRNSLSDASLTLLYPNSNGLKAKEGDYLTVKWKNDISSVILTSIISGEKAYKYNIEIVAINGGSETTIDSRQVEGLNLVNNGIIQPPYEAEFFISEAGMYKIAVTDVFTSTRIEGKPFTVEAQSNFVTMWREWDYSFGNSNRQGNPKGVAADGTSRIYLAVKSKGKIIDDISVSLSDGTNTTAAMLGKIMEAGMINGYSAEANHASQTTASITRNRDTYYFWYIAPDDYTVDPNDRSSSRFVNAMYNITYSDKTTSQETQQIEIVRPPVLLVHGLNSNHHCWDNFSLDGGTTVAQYDKMYKQVSAIDVYPDVAFSKNADVLLGKDSIKTQSSFLYVLKNFRKTGYSANRVDYICHSMGGCILRSAEKDASFYHSTNYGKGFTNKVITIDTPHNGSPIADLAERMTNWLYDDISEGGIFNNNLSQGSYGPGDNQLLELDIKRKSLGESLFEFIQKKTLLSSFFEQKITHLGVSPLETRWILKPVDAILDLRMSSGGNRFEGTPLRSHLIVGDIFPEYPHEGLDMDAIDEMFEADTYYAEEIATFEIFLDVVTLVKFYLADPAGKLKIFIDEAQSLLRNKNLKNRNIKVMKLCHQILSIVCLLGEDVETFVLDSDGVVSYLSQSAGQNGNTAANVSVFEGARSFHMTIVDKKEVGETVQKLLNTSIYAKIDGQNIFQSIPASPAFSAYSSMPVMQAQNVKSDNARLMSSQTETDEVSISEDEDKLQILNIENGEVFQVGENMSVNVRVTDISHLTQLQLTFQGKNYYAPEFAEYTVFDIPVTGYNLRTQPLYVKAYYDDGSSAWMIFAMKEVNVMPKEKASELYTDQEIYYLSVNETVQPKYTIVFPDFIFTGRNTDIKVSVTDETIVGYDSVTGSFVARKAGITTAELMYEDVTGTIYFVVEDPNAVELNNDATLSNLTVSAGTLSPEFNTDITAYIVTVANDVTSVTVIGTANHDSATVNGNVTDKPLDVGDNVVNITVTAEDKTTTKTYTVTIHRISNDATLNNLTVSAGTLSFDANTTAYTVNVANDITSIDVNGTANNDSA
ncbi:MAG: cadherin-like beta sandwich domain-containing protein, partial [Tannerella sp.]|nr:cadherin-like beta sandwich domain-containing protein [Tannerella sp.]